MTQPFTLTFSARSYELNEDGNLHPAVYAQWFEEAAYHASKNAGFGPDEYVALGTAWVVRELDLEFLADARFGEQVTIETWVSDFRRVRSHREYLARRARDGVLLARQRVDWVYLDRASGLPRRTPADMAARFEPFGEPVLKDFHAPKFSGDGAPRFETTRRVQAFEIDEMRIVNHPHYVNWIQEHLREALAARGGNADALKNARHFFEFKQPARRGDVVTLCSDAANVDGALIWRHEIKRGETRLVESYTRLR